MPTLFSVINLHKHLLYVIVPVIALERFRIIMQRFFFQKITFERVNLQGFNSQERIMFKSEKSTVLHFFNLLKLNKENRFS